MKKTILFFLCLVVPVVIIIISQSPLSNAQALSPRSALLVDERNLSNIPNGLTASLVYFPVGAGGSDVIPHQIVRTNTDHLYIFANAQSSNILRVYRTTGTGLPQDASAFTAPIQVTETSNPIGVDAVYDGANIIHVLINLLNGNIKDYPFNVVTNTFTTPITLATNGGTVASGWYVGTSGVTGMVDLSGNLHVAYWTNGNHILHRVYSYNSTTNVLTPAGNFVQVDTTGFANHPSVAVSPLDNSLTVAWVSEADNPPKIRTRTRASNGTWGSAQSASTTSVWTSTFAGINIDQGPSLIIDSSGTKHLTYIQSLQSVSVDYGQIHYVTDTGSGWVDQALNAFTHDPALAINGAGEIYIIGHGHPNNPTCTSMLDICTIKKNSNGTWGNPQLYALHSGTNSFDSSPSVKWSAVGFNRPNVIEFIFFMIPYDAPTIYYGRIDNSIATLSGSAGVAGATLSYADGTLKTVTADGSGNYSITVPVGWSGIVTPYKTGYTFTPVTKSYGNLQSSQTAQNYTAQSCASCADVNVSIAGTQVGQYTLAVSQSARDVYPLDAGPVKVESTNVVAVPIIAALRDAWLVNGQIKSFAQMMGLPKEQLSDTYWFPAYNNVTLSEQIRFANVDTVATTVTVNIGGVDRGSYLLNPNEGLRVTYALDSGPVKVSSTGQKIIASMRDAWMVNGSITSFTEVMGLPKESLSDTFLFPAYNNVTLDGQLRFANVDSMSTDVTVTIGTTNYGPYTLAAGASQRVSYAVDSGPVQIKSSNGAKLIAALRDAWLVNGQITSYAQLMGMPKEKLSDTYLFPAYNNVTLSGQLRFANVDTVPTTVTVTIGGVVRGSYLLNASVGQRVTYAVDSGPVEIKSSGGAKIIAAIRDAWQVVNGATTTITSFVQMMGLPKEALSTTYWFPGYNNMTLSGQLRFAVP